MSRIKTTLDALKEQKRKALIPYVMAGFPNADITPALMHGMVESGADIIELGVPFSDPMADGPVIQKAGEAALRLGNWNVARTRYGENLSPKRQRHTSRFDGLRQSCGML